MKTIYGVDTEVELGAVIQPDNWQFAHKLQESDWSEAQFRLPTGYDFGITSLAVNIRITGRTWRRIHGDYWIRVLIEFVGDDESSTYHGGWMKRSW